VDEKLNNVTGSTPPRNGAESSAGATFL